MGTRIRLDLAVEVVRRGTLGLLTLLLLAIVSAGAAIAITHAYAGWATATQWQGIDGYLRQSTTAALSGSQVHADYLNICGSGCATWVQTGTFQGLDPLGNGNYSAVHFYYENMDACGDYYFGDKGVPPQSDYPYYLSWDGGSSYNQTCNNGDHQTAYVWDWRKGSLGATPFYVGDLGYSTGQASAATEVHDAAPINDDYYGCTSTFVCTNGSYGLHVLGASGWTGLTSALAIGPDDPPFLHTYQAYWAFRTCPASC